MVENKIKKANQYIEENKGKVGGQYRLNYHLMGECGWINDPNGFIQYKGSYHLFYQYYPYKAVPGVMHWGHAISDDLVQWEHLPVALAPDSEFDKDGCFSGSAIEEHNKMYLIYTGHRCIGRDKSKEYKQTQGIAYSTDAIVFSKYECNPVIDSNQVPAAASKKDFRDPKVFKIKDLYYMILGSNDDSGNGQALLYSSKDLIYWEFLNIVAQSDGHMGTGWECPDLFPLGDKDVLMVSPQYMKPQGNDFHNVHSTIYMIGNLNLNTGIFQFDKKRYYPIDYGFDFYAPQTTIDNKGRRIMVAWMDMWETEMPTEKNGHNWAGAMTLPREVILKENILYFRPVIEIEKYRKNEFHIENRKLNGEEVLETNGCSYMLDVVFDEQEASEFGIKLRVGEEEETVLSYNTKEKLFKFNRDKAGIGPKGERRTEVDLIDNQLELKIFVDKSSIEVFIQGGEKVMTARIYPDKDSDKIKVYSEGECKLISFSKWDIEV